MCSKKLTLLSFLIHFLCHFGLAVWEDSIRHLSVRDADLHDPAFGIGSIQEYYRDVFDTKNWGVDDEQIHAESVTFERIVPGRYAVVFKADVPDGVIEKTVDLLTNAHQRTDGKLKATHFMHIKHAAKGFFATLSKQLVKVLEDHPHVEFIEPNVVFRHYVSAEGTIMKRSSDEEPQGTIQWDLDRVDNRHRIYDNSYSPVATGKGVDVYIIDTGIYTKHKDFGGRAKYSGLDVIDDLTGSHQQGMDCNGHGTHVAGTVGGKTFGVAKDTNLYSLRALDCSGTGSVDGIAVAMDHVIAKHQVDSSRPKVISLSLGIKKNVLLNTAIKKAVDSGIVVSSAAGNQAGDSCLYSPASSLVGLSISATDSHDKIPSFSNTGACVDMFAPGYHIVSTSNVCDTCTRTKSGTSMANPHVVGGAAIVLELNPNASPKEVKEKLLQWSTKGSVNMEGLNDNLKKVTPNRLLFIPTVKAYDQMVNQFAAQN